MEQLITYVSGEVVGGIFLYLSLVFVLLFIWVFMMRFSPVVNKPKFTRITFILIGLVALTFTAQRLARPPVPPLRYAAILPASADREGPFGGIGWALSEITTTVLEQAGPRHLIIMRPQWQVDAFKSDTAAFNAFSDRASVLSWARLVKQDIITMTTLTRETGKATLSMEILDVATGNSVDLLREDISLQAETVARSELIRVSRKLADHMAGALHVKLQKTENINVIHDTPSLWEYSKGRLALLGGKPEDALLHFSSATGLDSASALGYYGAGLSYGEMMLQSSNDAEHQARQIRVEFNLKRANQLAESFEPALSSLAYFYLFFKPEARYLDAEIALIAGNMSYDRDYRTYEILSFMQPVRWETFDLSTREEVLQKALQLNPAGFDVYLSLARSYLELSMPHDYRAKKAIGLFNIAHELRPDDFAAVLGLVQSADYLGQYDRALKLLQRMQELHPDKPDVYYNLGVVSYHLGVSMKPKKKRAEELAYYDQAEGYFTKCVGLNRSYGYAYLYLAKIYKATDRREPAIESLRTAMRVLKPDDPFREEARKTLRQYFPDVDG